MLLARVTEHLRTQNWFAVVVDFLVVVLGIFIGLQVTDWNQSRLDRATEIRFLQAMQTDLESMSTNIEETDRNLTVLRSALIGLAEAGDQGTADFSAAELDKMIADGMWDLAILKVQMDAYEELRSSVGTKLLGSEALRLALARWNSDLERYQVAENDTMQVQYRNLDNYLADHFPARRFVGVFDNAAGLPPPVSSSEPDHAAFISRQETQSRITIKYISVSNAQNLLKDPAATAGELSVLVADRLAELGQPR